MRKFRDIFTLLKRKKVFQTLIWQILFGVNGLLIKRVIPHNFDIVATSGAYYSTTTWNFGNRWFSELHRSPFKWFLSKLVGVIILVLVTWWFAKKWVSVCCETIFVMSGSEYFHDFPRKNNILDYRIIFLRNVFLDWDPKINCFFCTYQQSPLVKTQCCQMLFQTLRKKQKLTELYPRKSSLSNCCFINYPKKKCWFGKDLKMKLIVSVCC